MDTWSLEEGEVLVVRIVVIDNTRKREHGVLFRVPSHVGHKIQQRCHRTCLPEQLETVDVVGSMSSADTLVDTSSFFTIPPPFPEFPPPLTVSVPRIVSGDD